MCSYNSKEFVLTDFSTNNGLMHVLDRVMSPLNISDGSATSTQSSGPLNTAAASTVTVTAAPTSTNNAVVQVGMAPWLWTVLAVLGGILA